MYFSVLTSEIIIPKVQCNDSKTDQKFVFNNQSNSTLSTVGYNLG